MLKELFPDWRYSPAASAEAISQAEAALGLRFPEELRNLYLEADGVRENVGNAKYLLSLTEEDSIGSLVTLTKFHWEEWTHLAPEFDLKPYIFFGCSNSDEVWGINWKAPTQVIAFHHHMEGEFEVVGTNILEVYKANFASYEL
ncbi:SMI1/KNR4 family protein [Acidovorax sp. NPDC077693]|uniref:SMI1/KNR4 family protein n=1 Tax=unclassified Acidovorax TaxID=2684926 RepID=UPI0037C85693